LGTFRPKPVAEVPDTSVGVLSMGLEPFASSAPYPALVPEDSFLEVEGLEESYTDDRLLFSWSLLLVMRLVNQLPGLLLWPVDEILSCLAGVEPPLKPDGGLVARSRPWPMRIPPGARAETDELVRARPLWLLSIDGESIGGVMDSGVSARSPRERLYSSRAAL
jgi:hypothetical protein